MPDAARVDRAAGHGHVRNEQRGRHRPGAIVEEALATLEAPRRLGSIPELWDGRAGERIVDRLYAELNAGFAASLGTG